MSEKNFEFRGRFMMVFAGVVFLLGSLLMTTMCLYAKNKVIVIEEEGRTDAEEESEYEYQNVELKWKVKTANTKGNKLCIPINGTEYSVDEDYLENKVRVIIPAEKETFYTKNVPYGCFDKVIEGTGSFAEKNVVYEFSLDGLFETKVTNLGNELQIEFHELEDKPVVLIDPGHGGKRNGIVAGNLMEKNVLLKVGKAVRKMAADKPYKVLLTRTADVNPGVDERIKLCELFNAEYFIQLHLDANIDDTKEYGMYAIYNDDYYRDGFENVDMAEILLRNVAVSASNRAVELKKATEEDIALMVIEKPAVDLHIGYMSNSSECALLAEDAYIEKIAAGIIKAIDEAINVNGSAEN